MKLFAVDFLSSYVSSSLVRQNTPFSTLVSIIVEK
jgi:hypothetical protein